ncbi:c-type cytochrome [Polaromonas sp.]|uniref:c-type cytochrome n=1 Tax=Polaromonas sp. TaxID=1869339 RepID=UPI003751F2EC
MVSFQTQSPARVLLWVILATGVGSGAQARDPVAGKAKAGMCATCHGPLGLSQLPNAPHLAGQPAIYLVEQLKNYRSGKRQNDVMSVIAKPLTDQEIDDLSAWYASIQISVTAP